MWNIVGFPCNKRLYIAMLRKIIIVKHREDVIRLSFFVWVMFEIDIITGIKIMQLYDAYKMLLISGSIIEVQKLLVGVCVE